MKRTTIVVIAALILLAPQADVNAETRLHLATQYDWEEKLGFYLSFEGATLAELPLILGVADGENWRFDRCQPGFVPDTQYRIRAVISPEQSELLLDDIPVAGSAGAWRRGDGPVAVYHRPAWASDPGDWLAVVHTISVVVTREDEEVERQVFDFPDAASDTPLRLFEYPPPASARMDIRSGDTVTLEVVLEFAEADLKRWAPFIDRYGQCRYAEWPGKVRSDQELLADVAAEDAELAKMQPSPDYDRYGGYLKAGRPSEATGFFRVERHGDYWWLISPEGNPCFYTGVTGIPGATWPATPVSEREYLFEWLPPREGAWAGCWGQNYWGMTDGTEFVCLRSANLMRKYGPDDWRERDVERVVRRLKAWAFSGAGKWGGAEGMPTVPVLHRWGVPGLVRHPDVFDPEVRAQFRRVLEQQVVPRKDDPMVLGWTLGNEYDEIVTTDEVKEVLTKPAETPAKRALLDYAVDELYEGSLADLATAWEVEAGDREALYRLEPSPPDEDVERLRLHYADRYYDFIYRTVKAADPNHLYMGFSIVPGWWVNEDDWRISAPYCDVICLDRYSEDYEYAALARLKAESDKPVFIGEFSFPQFYDGERGFGRYGAISVKDEEEAAQSYERWVRDATSDPYCVGMTWFTYRDQPLTGRGPGRGDRLVIGERFAFGLVTETDRPKWPLVKRMREVNLQAVHWRLKARTTAE